ncbi:hypothetical protein [Chitinophaga polysaccharea]|uniref:hypothetical protein n=1 Tax=Chitinophaga polysaccharea TaxID=1293035 RepID=UPI0011A3AE02|nr:hypothetical protein [Chitinophaga polysaccharea]
MLIQEKLPSGIEDIGVSVLDGNIAGVYFLLKDTSTILSTLEAEYGPHDTKFTGIGDGYGYNWKRNPCLICTNTTTPYTSQDKRAVISLYICDKMKQITVKSISKYIKD